MIANIGGTIHATDLICTHADADQVPYKMPATIDDPVILDEIKSSLITAGIIKN